MRELKFRIWIKGEERYYDELDEEFYTIVPNGNVTYTSEAYEEDGAWFTDTTSATSDVIVEQYTGLKDKNGKEIYEGDIVQIDDHILGDFEVVWHNLGWKIKRSVGFETLSVHKSEDIVVIGNIHENPELLEEEE